MPTASAKSKIIKIGLECEQIEDQETWGIARLITGLLKNIAQRPELAEKYRFYLYFKAKIPKYAFLDNPIFVKKIIWQPLPHKSFVFYYYVFLPLRLWFAGLDVMYYPSYMLPIIHPPWTPSLVLLTDDIWHEMRSQQQQFHHKLAYWVFGYWAVWRAKRLMAISETSKQELIKLFGIAPERISTNLLAIEKLTLDPRPSRARPFLLSVGQAFPRRHLKETLLAFEKIAPDFPDLDFIIIGPDRYNPPMVDALVGRINQDVGQERVLHISHVSDNELAHYYASALALAYISSREAFGLPPLEALAHGSLPILADSALGHELFGDQAFFVAQPDSVDSITATLRQVVTDHAKRARILNARTQLLAHYTWRSHTDRFLKIISSL